RHDVRLGVTQEGQRSPDEPHHLVRPQVPDHDRSVYRSDPLGPPGMLDGMAKPRIVGGSARGRELETPKKGTRPSPSRLREALFDVLAFEPRRRVLDLFSGSGAGGLEAASRGGEATIVDLAAEACAVMRRNPARLDFPVTVVKDNAVRYASSRPAAFDVLFAAPPYTADLRRLYAG